MPLPAALCLGHPRFTDPTLAECARLHGPAAAFAAAWEAGGPVAAAHAAQGDFAVAVHDARGRAFLAVDRFATRSLCWRIDSQGRLHTAERADDLAGANAELDPQALFDYLFFHVIPSPRTVFAGVHRLPPGHCALWEDGRLTVMPWWVPQFQPQAGRSFEDWRAEFRGLLLEGVRSRLDGSQPACFLSGGTDSSTVAGMVREAAGRPAHTYSIGFEAEGYDEMAYARIAAKHFGAQHHEYYVTPQDLVAHIPRVAAHYDQPFGNSSALPSYCCALFAREHGATRLLAGDGGDELFGGNTRYAKQRVFGLYGHVPAPLRSHVLEPLLQRSPLGRLPLLKKGASYIGQARQPMPDRMHGYNLLLRLGLAEVLSPDFLARVDPGDALRQQREVWQAPHASSDLDRMLAYDWRYTLAECDLPKVCGTTGLAGVDVAFPMLDDALVDFSLRLPTDYKLKGMKLRWFFKEALRGFLPDEILAKKKQGFGLPFGVWLTRHEGLRKLAEDSLGSLGTRGIVRPDFVRRLLPELVPQHPGYYGEMVWILTMLEQWLRVRAPGARG